MKIKETLFSWFPLPSTENATRGSEERTEESFSEEPRGEAFEGDVEEQEDGETIGVYHFFTLMCIIL